MLPLLLDIAGTFAAPERCAACDARVPFRSVFCAACAATALPDPEMSRAAGEEGCVAPFLYGGAIAAAVTRFKYEGRADLARPLSHLLLRAMPVLKPLDIDVVVPIPLHRTRLVERGFNQAALLARLLATRLGARFAPRALAREVATIPQASLGKGERRENVQGAFVARCPEMLEGKRVLLIDDVSTTGATLAAAARAAREAKAQRVHAAVLARVIGS